MHPLVDNAQGLVGELASHRADHDARHQLTDAVLDLIRDAGFLGCVLPRELGGVQMSPVPYLEVLEALATGDAATAWCVMTATTTTLAAPYLARTAADDIFSEPLPMLSGVFAPGGKLRGGRPKDAQLTGRWSYASGSKHAEWFALGALTDDATGRHMLCFVPSNQVVIMDNWDTLGLAGTGSHDVVVDCAVPLTQVTSVFERTPWSDAALYRMPLFGMLASAIAACALGVARTALATVGKGLTAPRAGAELGAGLATYGELRARLDAARAYLLDTVARAFERVADRPADGEIRGDLRLAARHVAVSCLEVGRGAFVLAGGAAIRNGHPVNAALRDLETMMTHKMIGERVVASAARAVLGIGVVAADL